ncbi:MAG: hypothetical protein NZL93_00640, partial [Chthoniobacterales bacterium]|nr:hypothetical protein [Chthoniobacterales bacterium]
DVKQHLERMVKVRRLVSLVSDRVLYGAIAGMVVDEDARMLADNEGLYVLMQSGDFVKIVNTPNFSPRSF